MTRLNPEPSVTSPHRSQHPEDEVDPQSPANEAWQSVGHRADVAAALASCSEIIHNLATEIDSARATVRARALPVVAADEVGREDPYLMYSLRVSSALPPLQRERVVLLDLRDERLAPLLVCGGGGTNVLVASPKELPLPLPAGALLCLDDVWLLERFRDALSKVRRTLKAGQGRPALSAQLAEHAVGHTGFAKNAVTTPAVPPSEVLEPLNEEQQVAVHAAMRQRVLYLWGPPGTGKSMTVGAIVKSYVAQGRRVLVTAPSNVAADVIATAIARQLSEDPRFDHGLALRVGPRPTAELRSIYGEKMIPSEVASRLMTAEHDQQVRSGRGIGWSHGAEHRGDNEGERAQRKLLEILECCGVLVTPVQNVYLSRQLRGQFDVAVFDEASMISAGQLWLTVGQLATEQVVVAGDFMQLPAPVMHRRPDEVPWLSSDPFTMAEIPRLVAREDDPQHLVTLREQYRMAPAISDLVSAAFYQCRLRTAPGVALRPSPPWIGGLGSLILVDTTTASPRAFVPAGGHSRENPVHARLVAGLVRSLSDGAAGSAPGRILVLSPFARQAERLRDAIRPIVRTSCMRLRVATVHGAQGSEAETVILTLDDSPGAAVSQFMAAARILDTGARLLNVGISRARGRVIILAPVDFLMNNGGPVVRMLLDHLHECGQVLRPSDF